MDKSIYDFEFYFFIREVRSDSWQSFLVATHFKRRSRKRETENCG